METTFVDEYFVAKRYFLIMFLQKKWKQPFPDE